jgi:hypothetical protein
MMMISRFQHFLSRRSKLIAESLFPLLFLAGCSQTREANSHDAAMDSTSVSVASSSTQVAIPSAIADTGSSPALVTGPWIDAKQVLDTSLDAPNLQCAPKVFSRRDTITVRAEVPHGGYLVVLNPEHASFYLIQPEHGHPETRGPLGSSEVFMKTLITRFRADVRAKPAIYGRDTLEPVFNAAGKYIIEVGDNLESEADDDYIWKCTLRLDPRKP